MATLRELITKIVFNVDDAGLQAAERRIKRVSKSFKDTGKELTKYATLPIALIGGFALRSSAQLEDLRVSFETMLGSAEKADTLIRQLIDFAAKTPFQLPQVQENAKQLLAMGIETEKILPTLKALGDVAAGVGRPLSRIALNYGQVRTQTKLTGRELKDFTVLGVPIMGQLAKQFGVAESEIIKLTSQGKIGFSEVEKAFVSMTSKGGIFDNLMIKSSTTLTGTWSNFVDSLIKILAPMGDLITETFKLKDILNFLINSIDRTANAFSKMRKGTKQMLLVFAAVVAAAGPISIALGTIAGLWAFINFNALMSAISIGAVIAVFALFTQDVLTWTKGGNSLAGKLLGPWEDWRDGLFMIWNSISKFMDEFFNSIFSGNFSKVEEMLKNFSFIIKDVVKSFIKDIEKFFGSGVGKFVYKILSGTIRLVEGAGEELGTIVGSGGRYLSPEAVTAKNIAANNQIRQVNTFKMQFQGNETEQQKLFAQQLRTTTSGIMSRQIREAVQNNPEVD